jgi:hypothetical protein
MRPVTRLERSLSLSKAQAAELGRTLLPTSNFGGLAQPFAAMR